MAYQKYKVYLDEELQKIRDAGLYKRERIIHSPQATRIDVEFPEGALQKEAVNFCANNYLGLSSHPRVIAAAHAILESRGYGMSSVRFICGTQDIHRELERKLASFLQMDDAILYSSCFDANLGIFEALLTDQDAIISDRLNHASIIDGIRLCKARRYLYEHADMENLEFELKESQVCRHRLIVTDGAFSMDGDLAKLNTDLRPGGPISGAGDGGRFARHRLYRQNRPGHSGTFRCHGSRRYHQRDTRQRRSEVQPAGSRRPGRQSSTNCASTAARICFPIHCRRLLPEPVWRCYR